VEPQDETKAEEVKVTVTKTNWDLMSSTEGEEEVVG
jgi:hypothetical protein